MRMLDERINRIRESERKSHTEIYSDEKLYATDSWLKKPIKTVRGFARNSYDFIMAVSALEHIDTEDSFRMKLAEIRAGLREKGVVCLVMNSGVREQNRDTKETVDAQFEVNLTTEKLQEYLNEVFEGWSALKSTVSAQEYDIPREGFISRLSTNVVTFVARK